MRKIRAAVEIGRNNNVQDVDDGRPNFTSLESRRLLAPYCLALASCRQRTVQHASRATGGRPSGPLRLPANSSRRVP